MTALGRAEFQGLAAEWLARIGATSDPAAIMDHPAYREIVRRGQEFTPYILDALRRGPSLLAWALFEITGENSVPPKDAGNLKRIGEAWLKWAKRRGE